jgi:tetratricopeptide (TPR) repeat protein
MAAVVLLFMPILALAQGAEGMSASIPPIEYYVNLYTASNGSNAPSDDLMAFVGRMESKRSSFRDDHAFLSYLFRKTHQKVLKSYKSQASFDELLDRGTYNCLTGTAVYAMLLSHFGLPYTIIETNYHIFILTETNRGQVLLEATDPIHGFSDKETAIENRIAGYRKNEIQEMDPCKDYYRFSFNLYNEVTLDQLLGLLHYNLAITDYNEGAILKAINHLDQALELYNSPRIEEFTRVMQYSVVDSTLETTVKAFYVKKIQSLRKKRNLVMASAK